MKRDIKPDLALLPTSSKEGVKAFLSSSFIKGIGPVLASRIVEVAGDRILQPGFDFENSLREVPGLTTARIEELKESFSALKYSPQLLAMLFSAGLSDVEVEKIVSHYKKHTPDVIAEDPYLMVEDVFKLSFFTADKIGRFMGIENNDPRRLRGALLTSVKFYAEDGNMFSTEGQAVTTAARITGVPEDKIVPEIHNLVEESRLVKSRDGLYLPVYYKAEKEGAKKLAQMINNFIPGECMMPVPVKDKEGRMLSEAQLEAIKTVMNNPVTVITGGPGTGKTTAVRGIIRMLEDMDKKVVLAAPTGRAAKRLSDLSGHEAKTIHRLLGYSMGKGYRNKSFDADILVIDEASMLEQVLFNHLLQAIKPDTKIVLVGDVDQLPAIGAGDVLRDMIASGRIPVVSLSHNFRQMQGSGIAANASAIRTGENVSDSSSNDFIVISEETSSRIHNRLLDLVSNELPKKYNLKASDIQVVTPQQEGSLGAKQLNLDIQNVVNPDSPGIKYGTKTFRLGDRVMQKSNSAERKIYNGETGVISEVNLPEQWLEVTFSDGKVSRYSKKELKELSLSYATTVHKLQGSETDFMVMPMTMTHRNMLYRNLLYTAVSRAKKLCVLVGEEKAIRTAIDNPSHTYRNSNFKHRLQKYLPALR